MTITFGSVCSGIEAASVAWHPLGMRAAWLSEIEQFPCAVLAHRWPEVPNLGDMTQLARQILLAEIPAPPVLIGGTPCQDFSVAGMRAGLAGKRGSLTITYVELLDAIDHVRPTGDECVAVWENVPGVLSDKANAFGCFLGALVGESDALQPAGRKWTNAGCVYGPRRAAAWRVLDAQYFGVAQRRRRVFVVASARRGFDPAAVLFEPEGVRRDTPPRRGEGKDLAGHAPFGPALQCGCGNILELSVGEWGCPNCEGEEGPAVEVMAGVPAFGGDNQAGSLFKAGSLNAHGLRNDFATETFCVQEVAGTLQCAGRAAGSATSQDAWSDLLVPCHGNPSEHATAIAFHENQHAEVSVNDVAYALKGTGGKAGQGYAAAMIGTAVRRLTLRECERLQGFPDDYTLIPWRGKPAGECPDGPRYKALGNSKAVPVVRWIGRRLLAQLANTVDARDAA